MGNEAGALNGQTPQQSNGNNGYGYNQGHQHRYNNQHNHSQHCNHNNRGGNNHNHKHQQQKQVQVKQQDQLTIDTQLLLDDTITNLEMIKDYLNAVMNNEKHTKTEIRQCNQKVVVALQCFQMKVEALREDDLDFTDAFKSSAQIVQEFEVEFKSKIKGNKQVRAQVTQRLDPCLNYMKATLKGKDVPDLPYINNYTFNKETASRVMSGFTHAQNHVIPDRMKEVNDNNEKYKKEQKRLKQKYEKNERKENIPELNYQGLIQDYNTNKIAFGMSKKEQNRIIQQQQNKARYAAPDNALYNGMELD